MPTATDAPVSRTRRFFRSAPVRIILGLACIIGAVAGVQAGLPFLLPGTGDAQASYAPIPLVIGAIVLAAVAMAAYSLFVRISERRWPGEIAPRRALLEAGAGALAGFALFSLTVVVLWLAGAYHADSIAGFAQLPSILAGGVAAAVASSVVEEVLARGIIFRITERSIGSWLAIAISALLFGLAHLGNPHATLAVALGLALQAGVLLGAAFMVTRRLWLPIGLHFGWNFIQAAVFGGALSGGKVHAIVEARLTGPVWLSGGEFGVEGSVVATIICAGAAAALLILASRRRRTLPPFWRKLERSVEHAPAAAAIPA